MEKQLADHRERAPRPYGILIVDDEACIRGMLDIWLRQQGYATWLASDGRQAIDLYRDRGQDIDAVLLDIRMPGLDGPRTMAALQGLDPQVCCAFMSGDVGDYTEEGLRQRGATAVLAKPLNLAEVARVMGELTLATTFGARQMFSHPDDPNDLLVRQ